MEELFTIAVSFRFFVHNRGFSLSEKISVLATTPFSPKRGQGFLSQIGLFAEKFATLPKNYGFWLDEYSCKNSTFSSF